MKSQKHKDLLSKVNQELEEAVAIVEILDHMDARDFDETQKHVSNLSIEQFREFLDDFTDEAPIWIESGIAIEERKSEIIEPYLEEFETEEEYLAWADEITSSPSLEISCEKFLKRINLNFRLTMFSNYDCFNSHWFESQNAGYNAIDSYFADVMEVLGINPRELYNLVGEQENWSEDDFPDIPREPVVDLKEFWIECVNRSAPACLLVATISLPADQVLAVEKVTAIEVPAGTKVFFFSSWQGGGSSMSLETTRPMRVELKDLKENDYKASWELCADSRDYSVEQVYGTVDYSEASVINEQA